MSAPKAKIIWRTFCANGAPNEPGALKGGDYAQMRALTARHLAHNPRTTLPRAPVAVRSKGERSVETALYRHFGSDGSLLYVGISLSWPARTKAHAGGSRWFDQVARVELERFPTREAALEAEREAIKGEKPQFNIIHNRGTKRPSARPTWQKRKSTGDVLLDGISGPDAIVGPPLVYRDDKISVLVAHGEAGRPGVIDEVELGSFHSSELPSWTAACASVISIRRGDALTIEEAREQRDELVTKLRKHLRSVEQVDSDLALALANASRFPSEKARKILDDVAVERSARQ